ncbi:hypothetical protein GCM10009836_36070 [Pseudonocardia ailaonensis]|uniref:Solute-binding protein family 5 domain-containing protein n=1 Tax=Pseudonocardia ailaonensis TaxID=367279 RepID=A0ABN2N4U3_9PSEU
MGLALLVTALCTLAACSSGSSNAADSGSDGVAKVAWEFSPVQGILLDAVASKGGYHPYMTLMYDSMIHLTPSGPKPGLATDWRFPDARTVVLTLRKGVTFQDGTPFNAAVVKFSWDRIIASKDMQKSSQIKAMESVETPSDDTVIVHLSGPFATDWRDRFLNNPWQLAVVSPDAVKKAGGDFSRAPVGAGAGPYEFVSYESNQKLVLRANPNYWDKSAVTLKGIEFINTAQGAPTLAALKGGVANMAFTGAGPDIASATAQGLNVSAALKPDSATNAYFCTSKAPFNNIKARQAVAYAVNRDAFVKGPYGGLAVANSATIPTSSPNYPGQDVPDPYTFDPVKAKQLLAEAGVPDGTTITALADPTGANAAVLQVLQQQLQSVGLNLSILPTANAFADLRTKKPDIYYSGTGISYGSQSIFVSPGGTANYCDLDDPQLNAALARTQDPRLDAAQQKAAWADYQRVFYDVEAGFTLADVKQATISTSAVTGITDQLAPSSGEPETWAGITVKGR